MAPRADQLTSCRESTESIRVTLSRGILTLRPQVDLLRQQENSATDEIETLDE